MQQTGCGLPRAGGGTPPADASMGAGPLRETILSEFHGFSQQAEQGLWHGAALPAMKRGLAALWQEGARQVACEFRHEGGSDGCYGSSADWCCHVARGRDVPDSACRGYPRYHRLRLLAQRPEEPLSSAVPAHEKSRRGAGSLGSEGLACLACLMPGCRRRSFRGTLPMRRACPRCAGAGCTWRHGRCGRERRS